MVYRKIKHHVRKLEKRFYGKEDRNLALQMAVIAGFLLGIGAVFFKLSSSDFSLNIISNPYFIIGAIITLSGGFFLQISLKHGKTSLVFLTTTGLGAVIPIIGGLMLGEILSTTEGLGIILVIAGILLVARDHISSV